jgi:hypothetical protein
MIAAYPQGVTETVFSSGQGNHLGAFGEEVAAMERQADIHPVGEACTTMRIVAHDGLVSHVLVWRHGPLITHLSISGDELLAGIILGHVSRVADARLLQRLRTGPGMSPGTRR